MWGSAVRCGGPSARPVQAAWEAAAGRGPAPLETAVYALSTDSADNAARCGGAEAPRGLKPALHGLATRGALVLIATLMASCSRQPAAQAQRIAVLRFENLTGDASLDWISNAAAAILASEWRGATLAQAPRDAYSERAARVAHGYFEKRGAGLRFQVVMEDLGRRKIAEEETGNGEPLAAVSAIAKRIDPRAAPFSTGNAEAVEAWGQGQFDRAVNLDPDFSAAWLNWAESVAAQGNAQGALEIASRALMQPGLRSKVNRAQIESLAAGIRGDNQARIAALQELTDLVPGDADALRTLAGTQFQARLFAPAAKTYRQLAQADPADSSAFNMLGYAQACAGEADEARKSLEEYGRRSGENVNALDSLGEAMFLNGRFREAEKAFQDGYRKAPAFLQNAELWKAAHARWLSGDLRGADELMAQYVSERRRARDPLVAWREANWLYETGRREEARALLSREPSSQLMERQLAVWKDPDAATPRDLDVLKQLYERSDPVHDQLARTLYAASLAEAGRKEEARKLIVLWPLPEPGNSPLDSLAYPRFLDLRNRLR
jgi:Flp pilus assembly protein TadD